MFKNLKLLKSFKWIMDFILFEFSKNKSISYQFYFI